MRVAILGYDVEGRSSFEYFKAQGHELVVRDQNCNIEVPAGMAAGVYPLTVTIDGQASNSGTIVVK